MYLTTSLVAMSPTFKHEEQSTYSKMCDKLNKKKLLANISATSSHTMRYNLSITKHLSQLCLILKQLKSRYSAVNLMSNQVVHETSTSLIQL